MEFESLEIKKCRNGFIVTLNVEEGSEEYCFATPGKAIRFIKDYVETKPGKAVVADD